MKKYVKGFVVGVVITAISTVSMAESAEVFFNKIKVMVNKQPITADNVLINGRTFIPLRAVSEALGKEVVWIADTSTAEINDKLPVGWSDVVTFEGSTGRKTESFKITGSEAKVTWQVGGNGFFGVTLYSSEGKYVDGIANALGDKSEVTYIKKPGEYYLDISASDKYKIKIEQRP